MITAVNYINKIKWDRSENPDAFVFYYYDRVSKDLKSFNWRHIISKDEFSLELEFAELDYPINVPIHRLRRIEKDGDTVWERKVE